ncbi:MAG: energy transducer TonB [Vicinamibacterales bacterium]
MKTRFFGALAMVIALGAAGADAQSDSSLESAKALYDAASFDEALTVLDDLGKAQPERDVEEVQRYRALCLLALNRTKEAQSAIEIVVSRDPLYKLAADEAPPRMQVAFADVRRRLLPRVTEQLYAAAKSSFDRKEYTLAATQFQDLLTFLEDADAKSLPSLKEFRTLATGFHDLSASAPVAVTPAPAPAPAVPAQSQIAKAAEGTPPAPLTVTSENSSGLLQPAVTLRQQMPLWEGAKDALPRGYTGKLRIIIDEQGNVDDARIVEPVHPIYDALLLSAARTWKYEPAKLDGRPVRYVKVIEVVLKAPR